MKRVLESVMATVLAAVVFAPVFFSAARAEALEPKLLWKKESKGFLVFKVARDSGDVIVRNGAADITLFDRDGNKLFEWGPRIDRYAYLPDMSSDGRFFIFTSKFRDEYRVEKKKTVTDERVHYFSRSGKELWTKLYPHSPLTFNFQGAHRAHLSPDGKYVAIVGYYDPEVTGRNIELWDSEGNKLWVFESGGVEGFRFSPDSKYLVVDLGGGVRIHDLSENIVYRDRGGYITMGSKNTVSANADYVSTSGISRTAIIDRKGNIVLDGGKGEDNYALVNRNGTRGALWDENGIRIFSLPEKKPIRSYKIGLVPEGPFWERIDMSDDGRYLAISGRNLAEESKNNVFVIDTVENSRWETYLPYGYAELRLTGNGKYFYICFEDSASKKMIFQSYRVY